MCRHYFLLALLALSPCLFAQWSTDPAQNLLAVDRAGEQTQPKLVATSDGGFYLSWFDNDPNGSPAFGYDVYLQRFNAAGVEQWAHNGVLIADLGLSSTTDYDLAIDTSGHALVTFQDDRGSGLQITAARVSPAGTLVWGASGVTLTNTVDFVANPKIVGTSDGGIVAAWIQGSTIHLQRLDASGVPQWSPEVVLTAPTGSYATADLDASESGTCILALVHQTGGFSSPRHLRAQKFSSSGTQLWNPGHVAVFDGGSLQFGNFPSFVPDGSGGAVFAWYSASPALQCFAQRLDASGAELFPHNGSAVATTAGRVRVQPAVAFDAASGATFVDWVEKNTFQTSCGVSAQKFDAAGARQWGDGANTLVPLGASAIAEIEALVLASSFVASWTSASAFGQDVARVMLLDASGGTVVPTFEFSSTPAVKYRFEAQRGDSGQGIYAWRDERGSDPHLYLQNLLPDGHLGGAASSSVRNGMGVNVVCYTAVTEAVIGTTWTTQVSHAHHPGTTRTTIAVHARAVDGPLLGRLNAPIGQILVGGTRIFAHSVASAGVADPHDVAIPLDVGLVGTLWATQAFLSGNGLELTNALDVTIGF
jgi:hypothetical protein